MNGPKIKTGEYKKTKDPRGFYVYKRRSKMSWLDWVLEITGIRRS